MRSPLRSHLPALVVAAVLCTGASGAAAFVLAGSSGDGTGTGNSQPLDDNHRSRATAPPTPSSAGPVATPVAADTADDRPSGTPTRSARPPRTATPRPSRTEVGADRGSSDSGSGGSGPDS